MIQITREYAPCKCFRKTGGSDCMSVREFQDENGRRWRAWDVRPEAIHPLTRAEDYLTECYVIGWIVFETPSGDEKRRLCPWPANWAKCSDAELCSLLARADRVPARKLDAERQVMGLDAPAVTVDVPAEEDVPDVTDLHVVRSFRYPGGRLWTVCVVDHLEDGAPPALRFTAGARSIDLRPWPRDWADLPDDVLVDMLRHAMPRGESAPRQGAERRWRGDSGDS